LLCAVRVLGPAADDDRTGPAGAGAGQKQRCAKPLLDLCGGGEVLLLGALQSTVAPSVRLQRQVG
jgi:hypothetical protein